MANIYSHIHAALHRQGDRVVIRTDARALGAAQLIALVQSYAAALRTLQLRPGERIAVQVEKSVENVALYLACLQLGAIYLPLNTAYQAAEVEYFLRDAAPRLLVTTSQRETTLHRVAQHAGVATVVTLDANGTGTLPELAAQVPPEDTIAARSGDDLAVICYTSGTTGRSKGAMITHGNLLSNAQVLVSLWDFTAHDVLLHALPLYHIHGLFVALHCALLSGASIVLLDRFDARLVLDHLSQCTVMMGVPTFYTRLLALPEFTRTATHRVRLFISGSAPLLPDTFNEFEQRTGQRILERYGMTETGMIASNPLHGERRAASVGVPLPGVEVRIVDAQRCVLMRGATGTIEVRGANVFKGYWNMPDRTAEELHADGYFCTGDLGRIDADGYLQLVGRAKDLIISGGLNVYPKEVEDAIDALPGVEESAVFAISHADLGEAVAAAVVARPGVRLSPDDIDEALRVQLAGFKRPKRIYVVSELPRNAMGKVQKTRLREHYQNAFTSSRDA